MSSCMMMSLLAKRHLIPSSRCASEVSTDLPSFGNHDEL